jgi:hypothetical protein
MNVTQTTPGRATRPAINCNRNQTTPVNGNGSPSLLCDHVRRISSVTCDAVAYSVTERMVNLAHHYQDPAPGWTPTSDQVAEAQRILFEMIPLLDRLGNALEIPA